MPGWWQAPILTGKARRENSNPGSSVAHQTLTSPQAGLHQPGLWMVHLVGFTCAITEGVFLHLDYKRSGSPQSSGLLQIRTPPPYHSSSASHLAIPSINFADDYLENKGRHRWVFGGFFCHFVSNLYFAYSQFFDLGKYKKRWPHFLSRPCTLPCHRSCLGDRLNHSYCAKKMTYQYILYLCLKVLSKKL